MLKIKLARFGKRNQPHYRIVVTEQRSKRDGQYHEAMGIYAPTQEPKVLQIDMDLYKAWVKKGAQPTDTVAGLVKRYESGNPFPEKKAKPSKKSLAKAAAEKEAKEAEKAAPAEEKPAESEAPAEETKEEAPAEEATAEETATEEATPKEETSEEASEKKAE